ncbi:MAG: metalloregulator ArsR/SmtB family transcription factor [Actinomycetota bacterium]
MAPPPTAQTSRLASVGAALADPTRATIVAALSAGTAHTAGELARHAGVVASTASEHLSRLVDAGLVAVEAAGRHRYFRLASPEVATLIESIDALDLVETDPIRRPRPGSEMTFARSCYDHLAGELGVRVHTALHTNGVLGSIDGVSHLSDRGADRLAEIGIDVEPYRRSRRPMCRDCLDWTQRRHHLGGGVGAAILDHLLRDRWVTRRSEQRILRVSERGRVRFEADLGVVVTQ